MKEELRHVVCLHELVHLHLFGCDKALHCEGAQMLVVIKIQYLVHHGIDNNGGEVHHINVGAKEFIYCH